MSADALAIATKAVTDWLTRLKPHTVEYRITFVDLDDCLEFGCVDHPAKERAT